MWHTPPHVKDNFERIEDIKRFYNPTTSNAERKEILIKYAVTHILLNHYVFGNSNKLIEQQVTLLGYPLVVKNEDYSIFVIQETP
jgi:transcriptional regulator of NAD metabolism